MSGSEESLPDWDDDFDIGTGGNLFGRTGASGYFLKNMSQPTTAESSRYPMQSHYQHRDIYSNYIDEERGFRSTDSSVAPPEKKPVAAKSFEEQKSRDHSENAKPMQSFIDSIELRSWLLNELEAVQASSDCFRRLEQHIGREADLDLKAIEVHLQPLTKRFRGGFQHIPREAIMLKDQYEQHLQSIRNVIVGCCECFQRKRVAYQSQLRRVRDNSNMAIRNVMQLEREQTLLRLEQQKTETTNAINSLKVDFQHENDTLQHQIQSNQAIISKLQEKLEELQDRDYNRLHLQQEAVNEALAQQKHDFAQQIQQLKHDHQVDIEKYKEDGKSHLEQMQVVHERALEEIRRIESDRRHILEQERNTLETTIKTLQQQLSDLTLQFTITREKQAMALQEEQSNHEKVVSALMTEGLSTQATLKTEITQTLHRLQQEENRRFSEVETQFNRLRDQLVHSHAMEVEQLHDRHRRECQRQKAELEVQFNEQLMKMKHMHEQELHRQIRATDRLQRLVARHGGNGNGPRQQKQEDADYQYEIEEQERQLQSSKRMTSLTPPRGFKPANNSTSNNNYNNYNYNNNNGRWTSTMMARRDSPPPPPPPPLPLSHDRQQQQGQQTMGLNWGPLGNNNHHSQKKSSPSVISSSRHHQHQHHIPFPAPPDTLPLDEALASAKHTQGNSGGVVSISSNVRRVSSYLQALEEYLEGDGTTTAKVVQAVDEVLDVSSNLGRGGKNNNNSNNNKKNDDSDSQSDSLDGLRLTRNNGRRRESNDLSTTATTDSRLGRSLLGGTSLSDV